ncbi:MAG: hypothetical protein AAFV88_06810 [Planctomycetota bacterium]
MLQHSQPVEYKGTQLDCGYRIDLLLENAEVKTGLLINVNVTKLRRGIKRFVL